MIAAASIARRYTLATSSHNVRSFPVLKLLSFLSRNSNSGSSLLHRNICNTAPWCRLFDSASLPISTSLTHDLGGRLEAFGPIPPVQELLAWEQQCHSFFAVLASKHVVSTDELRRSIESLTPTQYETWTYYEKWSAGITMLLLEHKIITHDELQTVLFGGSIFAETTTEPRFQPGERVRVKRHASSVEWKRPHIRTPGYIYGALGVIERVCGRHGDPSFLAFGLEAPTVQLYRVQFQQGDIWPEHNSSSNHVVEVEVYEHWLEPSDSLKEPEYPDLFNHSGENDDCLHHSHDHHNEHGDHHVHEARPAVEERAIRREGAPRPGQELFQALYGLLLEKRIVSADEVRLMCERMDTAGKKLDGATLVLEAWLDPSFQKRLIDDPPSAAAELGIETSNPNAPTVLTVVPNTTETHNLVVCTLCSCYPSGLLGIAPSWYKSREYRARAVREPRKVLQEFGVMLPTSKQIRVHDSTADHRYLVLPERPPNTEHLSRENLRAIITRDSMIGVSVPTIK